MTIEFKTKKQAELVVGGLSKPGKMPGYSWSISAKNCNRGSKLRQVKGSVCSSCYACKNRYTFKNVINAHENRLRKLSDPNWVDAMSFLLKDETYFRWFDAGDLCNENHLHRIIEVCNNTPNCKHWLPTREYIVVKDYLKDNKIPSNLNIRISTDMVDKIPSAAIMLDSCTTSTVCRKNTLINFKGSFDCPATHTKEEKYKCDDHECRACWNKEILNINYLRH